MKFGVREICDVTFKALDDVVIGKTTFKKGQPVLLIDTATTSTVEGAATTVYAQGGRGNSRLIAWEGEKTLTFTVEDALLSPLGFAVLSGAGLFGGGLDYLSGDKATSDQNPKVHVHKTIRGKVADDLTIDLTKAFADGDALCKTAPMFAVKTEEDGSIKSDMVVLDETYSTDPKKVKVSSGAAAGDTVLVDFYIIKKAENVSELTIDSAHFAGYYYVEASTLFRKELTGKDLPAEITIPKVKIQSNFTFTMSSTGDPSTFTFTMDAMPGYTWFNPNDEVLMVMQVIDEKVTDTYGGPYMYHDPNEAPIELGKDAGGDPVDEDSLEYTP